MWNTYCAGELNSVLHIPDMASVRIGIYDSTQKFLLNQMLWRNQTDEGSVYKNVKRFGMHAEDGSYFDIDLNYQNFSFRLEFFSQEDHFAFRVTPLQTKDHIYFFLSASIMWMHKGSIEVLNDSLSIKSDKQSYIINTNAAVATHVKVNTCLPGILLESNKTFYITCNTDISPHQLDRQMDAARRQYICHSAHSDGWLAGASDALQKGLGWNTIYDHVKERICSPVSRSWCVQNGKGFGSYVLFEWDTFFSALMGATYSRDFPHWQIDAIFQEITPDGMIPNFGSERGGSPDRSQPPVGSYCILKLYQQFQDKSLLERYYEPLVHWNKWWFENRDGNSDGLLEWGSNPNTAGEEQGYFDSGNTMVCAMYESGLDNSPMYDHVAYNEKTNTMELADVGLNSLYALDCKCLAVISNICGRTAEEKLYHTEYDRIKGLMNQKMYDADMGMYCNLHWNGEKDYRFSPTNFYPLLAGIPSAGQAKSMVNGHLLNEKEFWGTYVIPSISKSCSAFTDQDYWRGRIWGPMNFLVYEGLKQYPCSEEFNRIAYLFADKSLQLFMKEWQEENHIHENYNCLTGDGDDKFNADPFYTWGALLTYIPMCELIYINPYGGIRFGNFYTPPSLIEGFLIGDSSYDLCTENGFVLSRNKMQLIVSDEIIIIDQFTLTEGNFSAVVITAKSCCITLYPQPEIMRYTLRLPNGLIIFDGSPDNPITLSNINSENYS